MTVAVQHSGELHSTAILITVPDSDMHLIGEKPFDLMFASIGTETVLDVTSKILHIGSELRKLETKYDKD